MMEDEVGGGENPSAINQYYFFSEQHIFIFNFFMSYLTVVCSLLL